MAALLVSGCAHRGDEPALPRALTVARGEVSARFVAGDRLGSTRLASPVVTNLIANLAPAAVPDATGERVAYNSWRGDRPLVRVRDGSDIVLAEGAYRPHGGATARSPTSRRCGPSRRRSPRSAVIAATSSSATTSRSSLCGGRGSRRATSSPRGQATACSRTGSRAAGPSCSFSTARDGSAYSRDAALVAVSPDARNVFVSTYGESPPLVRVLDVGTGAERARLRVPGVRWIVEAGSWRGGRVAASASSGIAVFGVTDAKITLQRLLRLDRRDFRPASSSRSWTRPAGR